MSFTSLVSQAKGNGSAKFSTLHFIRQRLTALILIPLLLWGVFYFIKFCKLSSQEEIILFISHPVNFTFIMIFMLSFLYHSYLGMENIIKDYIHCKVLYQSLHKLLIIICILTGFISIINLTFYHLLFRYFLVIG